MLKGIPSIIDAELLWVLRSMGHGDDLVIADRNFPAASVAMHTVSKRLIRISGAGTAEVAPAILKLLPLDSFVDAPIHHMQVVGKAETVLDVHRDMLAAAEAAEGRAIRMASIERHAFYAAARHAYAVVQTSEDRPYGCFILKKGVVFD